MKSYTIGTSKPTLDGPIITPGISRLWATKRWRYLPLLRPCKRPGQKNMASDTISATGLSKYYLLKSGPFSRTFCFLKTFIGLTQTSVSNCERFVPNDLLLLDIGARRLKIMEA